MIREDAHELPSTEGRCQPRTLEQDEARAPFRRIATTAGRVRSGVAFAVTTLHRQDADAAFFLQLGKSRVDLL